MKLSKLLKQITPLPWAAQDGGRVGWFVDAQKHQLQICDMRAGGQYDATYLAHAANVLPELVQVLRRVVEVDEAAMKELKAMGLANDVKMDLIEKCRIALARAEEVKEL